MCVRSQRHLAFGYKGRLGDIGTYDEIVNRDKELVSLDQHPNLTHHLEVPYDFDPLEFQLVQGNGDDTYLREKLGFIYRAHNVFGSFGDCIVFLKVGDTYIVEFIGVKAFDKPAFAADFLPFIVDSEGKIFFVGIVRSSDPGKGKPAVIGGFMDVDGYDFENALSAAIRESAEEVGLSISSISDLRGVYGNVTSGPFPVRAIVVANICGIPVESVVRLVDVIPTGNEEKNETTGKKRVSSTAVYTATFRVDKPLTKEVIKASLVPQDKVERNEVIVIEVKEDPILFGISHHETAFYQAYGVFRAYHSGE